MRVLEKLTEREIFMQNKFGFQHLHGKIFQTCTWTCTHNLNNADIISTNPFRHVNTFLHQCDDAFTLRPAAK